MVQARALVITGDGINCDYETAWALEQAGFVAVRIHDYDLLNQPALLDQFQLCVVPGGFSFGDEIASGKVLAVKLKGRLQEALHRFIDKGNLLLGICNGFQVLVQLGLLPDSDLGKPRVVSLLRNAQKKFVNRWVTLSVDAAVVTPFFRGLIEIELPIRHGEGRLALEPSPTMRMLEANLSDSSFDAEAQTEALVKSRAPLRYAEDVNGSFDRIAALTNMRGNVLGLMPHPEAFVRWTQHPAWTSRRLSNQALGSSDADEPHGLQIFKNAINHLDGI